MNIWPSSWPPSPPHSTPHSNELEHRLTTLEIETEDHGKRQDATEQRLKIHETILWLLGWVALQGKAIDWAPDIAKALAEGLKVLRP